MLNALHHDSLHLVKVKIIFPSLKIKPSAACSVYKRRVHPRFPEGGGPTETIKKEALSGSYLHVTRESR